MQCHRPRQIVRKLPIDPGGFTESVDSAGWQTPTEVIPIPPPVAFET